MAATESLDTLIEQLRALLPDNSLSQDVEKNVRSLIQSQLRRLDMVSREEFEAQCAVLERSREKIERLEAQLGQLLEDKAS